MVRDLHRLRIPEDLATSTEGDVAQVVRLTQRPGITKGTRRRGAVLDGIDPLGMLAGAVGDEGLGRLEVLELGFGQQTYCRLVCQNEGIGEVLMRVPHFPANPALWQVRLPSDVGSFAKTRRLGAS